MRVVILKIIKPPMIVISNVPWNNSILACYW